MTCSRLALYALLASAVPAYAQEDAAAGIAQTSAAFEEAFNVGNAEGVAALYTEDAVLLPPGAPRAEGREGAREVWQGAVDAGVTDLDLMTDQVDPMDGGAIEIGRFEANAPDGNGGTARAAGKFLVVWQQGQDGTWRLHQDIWNYDPPAE